MRKLLTKILSVIVAVTATLGLVMLPKTAVQANEEASFTFGATYGASVRYGDDIEVGLRFTIEVDKGYYKTLIGEEHESKGVKFGALVAPLWYVTSDLGGVLAINPEDKNIADVCYVDHSTKFDQQQPAESANHIYYATVTYRFDDEWKAEVLAKYAKEMPNASEEEIFTHAKLEALATELVCMPYHIVEGEEPKYAALSDARSMVKVANGAVIDGEDLPSDFNAKYLSTLVESTSEIYIEENGTIYGATEVDYNALNGATITANADAGDVQFTIENGVLTNASEFFVGYEAGNHYYVTAFKGHEVYRIKYMYVTRAIDSIQEFEEVFTLTPEKSLAGIYGYYILTKDLDGSSYVGKHVYAGGGSTYSGGSDVGLEGGTFDGLGHTISNITFKYAGLFGHATSPTLKNFALTGVTINSYYGSVIAHQLERLWGQKFDENGNPLLNGDGKNDWVLKEPTIENVYIQVDKVIWGGAKRVNILVDNSFPTSTVLSNVVIDYQNAEKDGIISDIYANTGWHFGTIGGNQTGDMSQAYMFFDCFSISSAPLYTRTVPYFAENQVEVLSRNGSTGHYINTIGEVLDPRVTEFLATRGKTPTRNNFAPGIKAYDDYAALAKDAENNEDFLSSYSDKYWVVANGVPYWKPLYDATVELVITDNNGNVIDLNEIAFEGKNKALTVKMIDETHEIPNLTISGEGIVVEGNKIKLAEVPQVDGTVEIVVEAVVDGNTIRRVATLNYTYKISTFGDVLYSADDKALDLTSLKRAGVEISSLEEIDGYVVNDEIVDTLDLEVKINKGTSTVRSVDDYVESQTILLVADGKTYEIEVYAYTKLIDEAEDLDYFRFKYKETGVITLHNGYYLVTKNIDASNYSMKAHSFVSNAVFPGGNSDNTLSDKNAGLGGVFDGNGHVISNLSVQSNGIFGWIEPGATIKDIAFTNVTLLAGNYPTLFSHGIDSSNTNAVTISNIYVQLNKMAAESGVLVNNGPSVHSTLYQNIVIDWQNFGATEMGWLKSGGGRFGTVTDLTVPGGTGNYPYMYENVYTITSSPVVALRTSGTAISNITVAGNAVTKQEDGSYVVNDANLKELLSAFNAYTLTNKQVQEDIKTYVDYTAMAKDYEANKDSLATFNDCWIVKDGVVYWKEIYHANFEAKATKGDDVIDGEITLTNTKTEISLAIYDKGGNVIPTTITAPEGLTVNGNVIKLESEPTSVGYYEVKLTAEVEGLTIEKWIAINYSNVIDVKDIVLYSKYDQSLDLPSLNKAIAVYDEDEITIEDIDGYKVGEATEFTQDSLDLEVIITTPKNVLRNRVVDTAQAVSIKVGNKVYNLNVYAYTRLIDELSDMDWISRPQVAIEGFTGDTRDIEFTGDGTNVYSSYDGYYLMTKNLDGLGEDGSKYKLAGRAGSTDSKTNGLTGVFDGNGYTISNVIVQSRGIFVKVRSGLVMNVGFKDVTSTGYYSCVISHVLTYNGSNVDNIQGAFKNLYFEGTVFDYANQCNGEVAVLCQNNSYGYSENIVIKHTMTQLQKDKIMAGKRSGIFSHQYNPTVDVHFNKFFVISDMPLSYCESTNAGWNKFVFAKNLLKLKADSTTEYELVDKEAFAFIQSLLDKKNGEELMWKPVLTPVGDCWVIDIADNVRQYIDTNAMAEDATANADILATFDTKYWTVVDGVPTWNTLND